MFLILSSIKYQLSISFVDRWFWACRRFGLANPLRVWIGLREVRFCFMEEAFAPVWCATPSARGVGAGWNSSGPSSLPRAEGAGGGQGADCVNECGGGGR